VRLLRRPFVLGKMRPSVAADLFPRHGLLQPLAAGLGGAHRVQAAGNDEPIPLNRVGDAGRIGLDRGRPPVAS
jgi:hypothetical protein